MSVYKPKGSTTYVYDFWRKKERYTGDTGETTKTKAREVERAIITAVEAGHKPDAASELSFRDACQRYYDEVGQHRKSWKDVQRALELLLYCVPPQTKLKDLTGATIIEAIRLRRNIPTGRGNGHPSNATINRQIIEFSKTIHRRARDIWGAESLQYIDWRKLRLLEPKAKKVEIDATADAALHEAMQPHWQVFRDFILTYGPRLDEMFFPPSDVWQGSDGVVRIRLAERKGADEHVIPLDPADGRAMLARKSQAEAAGFDTVWMYHHRGRLKPMTYSGARSAFRRAKIKTGIGYTAHDHRHHAGTEMTRSQGIRVAQKLLGHTSISTTERYSHVLDQDVLEGINATKSRRKSREQS